MPFTLAFLADLGIVEGRYSGRIDAASLREAFDRMLAVGREHGAHRFLSDCTALHGGHTLFDLYELVDRLVEIRPGHRMREALLLPVIEPAARNVEFWQTACRNRGLDVRCFHRREDALDWLQQD